MESGDTIPEGFIAARAKAESAAPITDGPKGTPIEFTLGTLWILPEPEPVNQSADRGQSSIEAAREAVAEGQLADDAVFIKLDAVRQLYGPALHAELDEVVGNHRSAMSRACDLFELAHSQAVSQRDLQTRRATTREAERDTLIERVAEADDLKNRALAILKTACEWVDGRSWPAGEPEWSRAAIDAGFYEGPF